MFTVKATVNEDGTYAWSVEAPDGAVIPYVRVLGFLNDAARDVLTKMVAPPEPPAETPPGE